jgi:hypothetical protein
VRGRKHTSVADLVGDADDRHEIILSSPMDQLVARGLAEPVPIEKCLAPEAVALVYGGEHVVGRNVCEAHAASVEEGCDTKR